MGHDLLFILNPVAGHGRSQRVLARLQAALTNRSGVRTVTWSTSGPGHARELALRAAREGYTRIVAVGGDGTVHEVLNGLMEAGPQLLARVGLGVVPAGSGNDFARNLGIPAQPQALADRLTGGTWGRVDVGLVNGRYFGNVAGVGFDAEVAALANRLPKYLPGTLTYLGGALAMLARYRNARVSLVLDGTPLERRVLLVAVGNGACYAGGMIICPGARMDDGRFRVVVAGDLTRLEVLRVLPTIYRGGHMGHPKVEAFDAAEVVISADRRLFVQADGEIVGTTPARLRILPRALQVMGLLREAGADGALTQGPAAAACSGGALSQAQESRGDGASPRRQKPA